jgi:hypothetical protein
METAVGSDIIPLRSHNCKQFLKTDAESGVKTSTEGERPGAEWTSRQGVTDGWDHSRPVLLSESLGYRG